MPDTASDIPKGRVSLNFLLIVILALCIIRLWLMPFAFQLLGG
jgi:hypothetical protein